MKSETNEDIIKKDNSSAWSVKKEFFEVLWHYREYFIIQEYKIDGSICWKIKSAIKKWVVPKQNSMQKYEKLQ